MCRNLKKQNVLREAWFEPLCLVGWPMWNIYATWESWRAVKNVICTYGITGSHLSTALPYRSKVGEPWETRVLDWDLVLL